MLEKLFPIDLPSGYVNNGTKYQSKGRWYTGNLVRFFQGNKQPIGGWVQRTLTGAAIVGVPNAAHSWQLNDGSNYLAVGTTTNLYVVSSTNVVSDITPADVVGDGFTHLWQLDNFGQALAATFNVPLSATGAKVNNLYIWAGNPAVAANQPGLPQILPNFVFGTCATPERFLLALRGQDGTGFNGIAATVQV